MFDKNNPYTLRVEEINDDTHYYVSFRDGQADLHETEIDLELYNAFREFEKHDERQKNFFRRHVEHSEIREETLNKRAIYLPKGIEECVCDDERSTAFWSAVNELPLLSGRLQRNDLPKCQRSMKMNNPIFKQKLPCCRKKSASEQRKKERRMSF